MNQRQAPTLQDSIDRLREYLSTSKDFIDASNHPYSCRCDKCRDWWKAVGPDRASYGPFTKEEIDENEV